MKYGRWSAERIARFIRDWREGLSAEALREKYAIQQPAMVAKRLREAGHAVPRRDGGRPTP